MSTPALTTITDSFPPMFTWGVASASYQIEGAAVADGKGESIWDRFCGATGVIADGSSGATACDHYYRYPEDIQLMKTIGCQAYRFSIAWSRVQPNGHGAFNPTGMAYYDRLVDLLLASGITPYATLYHWDLPQALQEQGGWLKSEIAEHFSAYAEMMVSRFSDRVQHWITLNEPQCFIGLGYHEGNHAPGLKLDWRDTLLAAHNSLLAHGLAVLAARAAARQPLQIGISMVGSVAIPDTLDDATVQAARVSTFASNGTDLWNNAWFADPIFLKRYPPDGVIIFKASMPDYKPEDMEIISQPLDFYGANIYRGDRVRVNDQGETERVPLPHGFPRSAFAYWAVTPEAMYWGPKFYYERYQKPILITENGFSSTDWIALDGKLHDPQRIDYTARYLMALHKASIEGVDVRGYFHWTLLDNFEWGEGYNQRFGLVHVDFETQERRLKDSALWYRSVIESNGAYLASSSRGSA